MLVYKKVLTTNQPHFYLPSKEYPGIGFGVVRGKKYCNESNTSTWSGVGLGRACGCGCGRAFGFGFGHGLGRSIVTINVDNTVDNFIGSARQKCRFKTGEVVEISDFGIGNAYMSWYDASVYNIGKIEEPLFNHNDGIGCFPGIHCFLTRGEAENYCF